MDVLIRIGLVVGLLVHKLFWEVMKRRDGSVQVRSPRPSVAVRSIKLIKIAALVFLLAQTLFLDLLPISEDSTVLRVGGILLFLVGLTAAMVGRWQLGNNWVDLEDYQVVPQQEVVARGLYRYIRHPIYSGDLFLLVGLQLALNSWLVLIVFVLALVVIRQAVAEERLLCRVLGGYDSYRRTTKRFIPFVL